MKKKFIQIILFSLSLVFVIPSVSFASNYGLQQGDYVDLNGYRFIVLDPETDYLFYDGYLENRAFDLDNTNIFNPNDPNNIGYYLNNTFLNNIGAISNYVKNHDWTIGTEKDEASQIVNTRIGLLSYSDWKKYSKYYSNSFLVNSDNSFWTRTPASVNSYTMWMVNTLSLLKYSSAVYDDKSVRPALYLESGLIKSGLGTKSNPYLMSTEPVIILTEIKDLSLLKTTPNEIVLTWKNPTENIFSHLNIYKDDVLLEANYKGDTYTFSNLTPSKEYKLTIRAVDNKGYETDGISIIVSTDDIPLVPEVQNLKATTKHDRINLSWQNPESEYFHHVRVYRRTEQVFSSQTAIQPNAFEEIFVGKTVEAEETDPAFDPMFETNGTYWNDLTVEPSTTYGYKLTTENIAGAESEGLIVQATTLAEPTPEMEGEEVNTDENGDYKVTWTSPSTGKVKILIGGSEYAVVEAGLMQYVIPAEDMEYDLFGNPQVELVAVSPSGLEGVPTNPPIDGEAPGSISVTMPITANDFLKTVMSLIGWIGPFILLALAIRFAPRIIAFLKGVIAKYREGKLRL